MVHEPKDIQECAKLFVRDAGLAKIDGKLLDAKSSGFQVAGERWPLVRKVSGARRAGRAQLAPRNPGDWTVSIAARSRSSTSNKRCSRSARAVWAAAASSRLAPASAPQLEVIAGGLPGFLQCCWLIVGSKGGQSIPLLHERLELRERSIPLPAQRFELVPELFGFLSGRTGAPSPSCTRTSVELILRALLAGREPVPLGAELLQLPRPCFDASRIDARELSHRSPATGFGSPGAQTTAHARDERASAT